MNKWCVQQPRRKHGLAAARDRKLCCSNSAEFRQWMESFRQLVPKYTNFKQNDQNNFQFLTAIKWILHLMTILIKVSQAISCTPSCDSCMNSNSLLITVLRNFQWQRRKRGYWPTTYIMLDAMTALLSFPRFCSHNPSKSKLFFNFQNLCLSFITYPIICGNF